MIKGCEKGKIRKFYGFGLPFLSQRRIGEENSWLSGKENPASQQLRSHNKISIADLHETSFFTTVKSMGSQQSHLFL